MLRLAVEHVAQQHLEQARDDEQQRDRARVAPQLDQHPSGRRDARSRRAHPAASSRSIGAGTPRRGRARPCGAQPVGGRRGQDPPLAHEQQAVAVGGLVHDVARDQQACRRRRQSWKIVHRLRRSSGSSPTVGSSSTSTRARSAARWRARRAPAARPRASDDAVGERARPTAAMTASTRSGAAPRTRGRRRGSRAPRVAVDRRRLGHVADAPAQRGRARRLAQDGDAPRGDDLDADDRAHQGRLAAPARPQAAR